MAHKTFRDWQKSEDPAWDNVQKIQDMLDRDRIGGSSPHEVLAYIKKLTAKGAKAQAMLEALYQIVPGPVPSWMPFERTPDFKMEFRARLFDDVRATLYPPPYVEGMNGVFYMPTIDRAYPSPARLIEARQWREHMAQQEASHQAEQLAYRQEQNRKKQRIKELEQEST